MKDWKKRMLAVGLAVMVLTGCDVETENMPSGDNTEELNFRDLSDILSQIDTWSQSIQDENRSYRSCERFGLIETAASFDIVYDKVTRVVYTVSNSAYGSGDFTVLVDAEGKPLTYEAYIKGEGEEE